MFQCLLILPCCFVCQRRAVDDVEAVVAEYAVVEDSLIFKLNVSNVANKLYADALYTAFYVPGQGRLVNLTGTYKF